MSDSQENPKIIVDEDWKSQVQAEKEALKQADATTDEPAQAQAAGGDLPRLPPASFDTLLTMLATQATVLLQEAAAPNAEQRGALLDHSKHFIDTLAMLQEKTSGNLAPEEALTLENVLHELRMGYVSLAKN